jgi:outer membrane protein, multidrug efflux system
MTAPELFPVLMNREKLRRFFAGALPRRQTGPTLAGSALGAALAAALSSILWGCAVGPDYRPPKIATPAAFVDLGDARTDPLSRPTPAEADLSRWWRQFNDPTLNGLIDQALAQNLNLKATTARLRQAREQQAVAAAAGLPHVNGTAFAEHFNGGSKTIPLSPFGPGQPPVELRTPAQLNFYLADFDASWELDIFGGVRRSVEQARANTEAWLWQKRDVEVTLTAEVAADYLELRLAQQQIVIAQQELQAQQGLFTIIAQQHQTGFVNRLNVNQQTGQVEPVRAQIAQYQADARTQIHALAVLLGLPPEALDPRLAATGPIPSVPAALPVGLPSDLLRRRPDVRQAERQLAAATAGVGVQVANLYPKFDLLAAAPIFFNTTTDHLFDASNAGAAVLGLVRWPVFQGGQVRANIRAAKDQREAAYFTYRQTILSGLENVEDALARYQSDQQRLLPLRKSREAAQNSLLIARQQYGVGLVNFLNVLQAENAELNARNQVIQVEAQLGRDLASLYTALGGGWSEGDAKAQTPAGVSRP